jgi:hypothetical protein
MFTQNMKDKSSTKDKKNCLVNSKEKNYDKRGWRGEDNWCVFCSEIETADDLLIL